MTTIFILIIHDRFKLFVSSKQLKGAFILPLIESYDLIRSSNDAKKTINKLFGIKLGKNCTSKPIFFSNKNTQYVYVDIDLDVVGVTKIVPRINRPKYIKFDQIYQAVWYGMCNDAINWFKTLPSYKEFNRILLSGFRLQTLSKQGTNFLTEIKDMFTNIIPNSKDRPDIVLYGENILGYYDEFEISATEEKSGYKGKLELIRMENELNQKIIDSNESTVHISGQIDSSINYLWNNFISKYDMHFKKCDDYDKKVKVFDFQYQIFLRGFFVVDSTPLGTYFFNKKNETEYLYLFHIKEFWNLFMTQDKLDFMLVQNNQKRDTIYFVCKKDYESILEDNNIYELNHIKTLFFQTPQLIGTKIKL